jgi:putative transposase
MLLADAGIVCSMNMRGDCWDNAPMESFFSTLKTERLSRRIHRSRDECRADVFDYIERFYNSRRQHSTLGTSAPCSSRRRLLRLTNLSGGTGQAHHL